MSGKVTMRRRLARYRIASGDGPIDRVKIGCAFATLKGAYWVRARVRSRQADLASTSVVSNRYRFAFCGIPKVATKSVGLALYSTPELEAFTVNRPAVALVADGSPYRFHHKFSFVRNPWSRIVSCYRDKITIQRGTVVGRLSIIAQHPGLSPWLPFDTFVEWLCSEEGSDRYADRHWMSQHNFIADGNGAIVCDSVGRLETIENDFETICEKVRLPRVKLPHSNRSSDDQASAQSYRDLYNDRTKALIARRYERDIDVFKYAF